MSQKASEKNKSHQKVDNWFATHTFHHSSFNQINKLVELKKKLGVTISLCFPTLNEEKTIGKEIVIIKSELQQRYNLLDEIAVIDSGSTDKTREIAKEFGAKVFLSSEHLTEEGNLRGKGENLWKAIYLLKSDIIVYIDADINNIHPKFVYGLIGPLLMSYGEIEFVKGFYNRPLNLGTGLRSNKGGGRVTEILIRPLFSQFFPELGGIIQPLSGEFAGSRKVLETLPFPVGYGVETSTLIDISAKFGLDVIAQVDLDERIHRNQSATALGRMSFGILQTFWNRLEIYKGIKNLEIESYFLNQIETTQEEKSIIIRHEIREHERKPMNQVAAYQKLIHSHDKSQVEKS